MPAKKTIAKSTKSTDTSRAKKARTAAKGATPGRAAKAAKAARPARSAKTSADRKAGRKGRAAKSRKRVRPLPPDVVATDPSLFAPLTEGERADALRVLTEDPRLSEMAGIGRYRVIATEPLVAKPPVKLSGQRLARIVVYDYAADRSVDACVNLDASAVEHLAVSRAQPMLAREEEAAAIAIAMADERVKQRLSLGDEPQVAMHYWSHKDSNLAYARRSAAVIFGAHGERPSLVAVVDLIDNLVSEIVPADQW
jgi:hypothetical protein